MNARFAVDDEELRVVAHEIVGGTRDGDAGPQEVRLELAQPARALAVRVGNQGAYGHTACDGVCESPPEIGPVEPEHHDVDGLAGMPDRRKERRRTVVWLHEQLQRDLPAAFSANFWPQSSPPDMVPSARNGAEHHLRSRPA